MTIRDDLERDGFCAARGVFSTVEIARLRDAVGAAIYRSDRQNPDNQTLAATQHIAVGDLLAQPELDGFDYLIFNQKLLAVIRELVGERLVYFGDSSVQMGEGTRGFHKDCVHREDSSGTDWQSPYDLVRFGLYLQDHSRHSGGLKVRRGSHRVADSTTGAALNVDSREGDLIVWKLTTSHSGNVVRPRWWPSMCLHPGLEGRVPRGLRIPEHRTRMSLFGTLAAPGRHLDTYLDYIAGRPDFQNHYAHCSFTDRSRSLAASRRVELRVPMPAFASRAMTRAD